MTLEIVDILSWLKAQLSAGTTRGGRRERPATDFRPWEVGPRCGRGDPTLSWRCPPAPTSPGELPRGLFTGRGGYA